MKKIQTIYNDSTEGIECLECGYFDVVWVSGKTYKCEHCLATGELDD